MEPVYAASVTVPQNSAGIVYKILSQRRGHVLQDGHVAGTPLSRVDGLIPVIDSFGFETDLRIQAHQASVSLVFDRWGVVPGDPLDRTAVTRPLASAPPLGVARDFMLKTRRRKGLSEDVTVAKFLEPEQHQSLVDDGTLDGV